MIVGFCGETEAQFEATLDLLRTVRYDQVFAAAYSVRPGTPAARLADDVPGRTKRRRLNELLAVQEAIGLERNRAWLGRTVEVLVESSRPARSHDHERRRGDRRRRPDGLRPDARAQAGPPRRRVRALVGRLVEARIEHAGPYALREALIDRGVTVGSAAPRHRRGDRDGQDRAVDPARRTGCGAAGSRPRSSRPTRARSIAGSTSARPRSSAGGSGPDPAPRPRPRRSGRAIQRGRVRRRRPWRRSPGSPSGAGWRSSSVGPGSTCARSRAGSRPRRCRATRRSGQRSRRSSPGTASRRSPLASTALAPARAAAVDLRNPRRVVRALEIAELQGDAPAPGTARLPRPGRLARSGRRPGGPRASGSPRERAGQFAAGLLDEARRAARAVRSRLPAFTRSATARRGTCSTVG